MGNNFIDRIKEVFGSRLQEVDETDDDYIVEFYGKKTMISKDKIRDVYNKYNELIVHGELGIHNNYYYECLVQENGPILNREEIVINDNRNNLKYHLGQLSDEYIIFLIEKVFIGSVDYRRKLMLMTSSMFGRLIDEEEEGDFFNILRLYLRRFTTLKINSTSSLSINEYKTRVDAFLFHISFNTGFSINKVNYIDEYFGKRRQESRRNTLENIEAPQRKYVSDLVYHYQMGLSTHHPAL